MHRVDCDVGIVGAGVAGLSAAGILTREGLHVRCLEAADRVGGRILTVHDPLSPLPVELGAEFVHGRPPVTWEIIRSQNLTVFEHTARALCMASGRPVKDVEVGELAGDLLSRMARSKRKSDETFEDFLRRSRHSDDVKNWARIQVEGFNAARSDIISVRALVRESEAADQIDGDRSFRILNGYDSIPLSLLRAIPDHESLVQLNTVVETVRWQPGSVEVVYRSAFTQEKATLRCRRLLVTVPLGVLQAAPPNTGSIHFDPEPASALRAARALKFGQVYRVTLRFHEPFWEENDIFKSAGFLISRHKRFFTWWTMHPIQAPLLTAWMAGSAADRFHVSDPAAVASEAVTALGVILKRKIPLPRAFYFHDWRNNPFFRGAYSYAAAGAYGARAALAKPESETLFFAGEAANLEGHGGTVHGAIESGLRSAHLIAEAL